VYGSRLQEPPEVVIVDNHSCDGTVEMLRERYPDVRVIVNEENLGFSVASNMGIRASVGRYVLLLNPDTELSDPDTLGVLVDLLDTHPRIGAAGCALVGDEGEPLISAGFAPGPGTLFAFGFMLSVITRDAIKGLCFTPRLGKAHEQVPVAWVSGACMVVRRAMMDEVGLFDESYFLYGEDIEWGCRITRSGWAVVHLPWVQVYHHHRGTQADRHEPSTRWIDGLARAYMESEPGRWWWFLKLCLCTGFGLRAVVYHVTATLTGDSRRAHRAAERVVWFRHALSMRRSEAW
jgi:N-acetylglucosaminyl-diphospho-decaprenol L-rhamnosyltransferase